PQVDTSVIVGTKKIPTRTAPPPGPFPRPFRNESEAAPMPGASAPLHRGAQAGSHPQREETKTMSNDDLVTSVTEELYWDPKLDSSAIAVSADNGAVTLRGAVGTFREKREAAKDARRVSGVTDVSNDLQVRLMTDHQRDDAAVRADVLQSLSLDTLVP